MQVQRTILLVSADELLKRTIAIILMGAGFFVIHVSMRTEAIQTLETKHVDLVFLDIKEEPFAFLVEIHQKYPDVPLLTLGRVDGGEEAEQWRPMYTCLEKPADPEMILDHIQEILALS